MKRIVVYTAMLWLVLGSCKKEVQNDLQESTAAAKNENASGGVIRWADFHDTFPVAFSAWNPCTGEMIDFSGTGHYRVQGFSTQNGFNYTVHYNAANIQGVGQVTGIIYRTTDSFNYHNKGSFDANGQTVFNQRGPIRYISQGSSSNLISEDDWHLTINANGEVVKFWTTGGRISSCQ